MNDMRRLDMQGPNGQQPRVPMAVPDLSGLRKQNQAPSLGHFRVCVVQDGQEVVLDYMVSDFGFNPFGALVLVTNGQMVATYAPGVWKSAMRADVVVNEIP